MKAKTKKEKKKQVSNAELPMVFSDCFRTYLPSHIETPPPNGIVWFVTGFPFFVNFFCVMYLVGIYSFGRS